jgi:cysteinyl-tRNA synthetase
MNITDIDDKIINKSLELGIPFEKFARDYETEFFKDMKSLNVRLPDVITRVTEYVPEIIEYISKIIENGYAY